MPGPYVPRPDRYRELCEIWRRKYLAMDREALRRRFGLRAGQGAHYITYFARTYRLDQADGSITLDGAPVTDFDTVISIYTLFHYAKPEAKVSGRFVPFREVRRASPFDPAFRQRILEPLARVFSGRTEALRRACEALGGAPLPQGDVGFVIPAFDWMPIKLLFWDGDGEFPAQANLLFDADITDFTHEESVVLVGADLLRRLTGEAGLADDPALRGQI